MYVLTIDQRGSRSDRDRVPGLLAELRALGFPGFERSVGDELQGLVDGAADAVDIALHALRSGHWYVGIGLGEATVPDGGSPREGVGPAFVAARTAVELAKAAASRVPLSVVAGILARKKAGEADTVVDLADGNDARLVSADAEAVLRLIGKLRQERSGAQWKVVDTLQALEGGPIHGVQKQAAERLGITEQSVSRTLLRSGWQEEKAARPAAARLLRLAHQAVMSATIDTEKI